MVQRSLIEVSIKESEVLKPEPVNEVRDEWSEDRNKHRGDKHECDLSVPAVREISVVTINVLESSAETKVCIDQKNRQALVNEGQNENHRL